MKAGPLYESVGCDRAATSSYASKGVHVELGSGVDKFEVFLALRGNLCTTSRFLQEL